ncbi:MAG TPA: DUF2510 domain-containing protein [Acidimicrobiales bacterium]|nr:DUF2510 domain-containing protein [Acidimicrobiales bacterium]
MAMTLSDSRRSRHWGASHTLRLVCAALAVLAVAGALVIAFLPLPRPAAGGTCGPGRGSESAMEAFFDPVSIGAGAKVSGSGIEVELENLDRLAFIGECQSSTNGRMVDALALLIVAGFFALVVPPAVRRAWGEHVPATASAGGAAPPGWYPDPANAAGWRWWDGHFWGHHTSGGVPPPSATGAASHPGEPLAGGRPMYPGTPPGEPAAQPEAPTAETRPTAETPPTAEGPPPAEAPPVGGP